MKKKLVSGVLVLSLLLGLSVPITASTSSEDLDPLDTVIERVSALYQIPVEDVRLMDEADIRNIDVPTPQAVNQSEEYIKFTTDKEGVTTSEVSSEREYQLFQINPIDESNSETTSWMKITATIVDDGDTLSLSARYVWLTQPYVVYRTYDQMSINYENGTDGNYTYGYHWYTLNGKRDSEKMTDYDDSGKFVLYTQRMNDSGMYKDEYFSVFVRINKDYGAGMERVHAIYAHQYAQIDWSDVLTEVGFSLVSSLFDIDDGSKSRASYTPYIIFTDTLAAILGNVDRYYEQFAAEVEIEY